MVVPMLPSATGAYLDVFSSAAVLLGLPRRVMFFFLHWSVDLAALRVCVASGFIACLSLPVKRIHNQQFSVMNIQNCDMAERGNLGCLQCMYAARIMLFCLASGSAIL